MSALTGLALAACGATGVALLVDPLIGSPISRSLRVEPAALGAAARQRLNQAGLADVSITQLVAMSATAAVGAAVLTLVTLGAVVPAFAMGVLGALMPVGLIRRRRRRQLEEAREAWPAMIEEIRLLCASVGRSIPQALFEVGRRAPEELRPAFDAAHREWLLSRDLTTTTELLRDLLGDPTADATCETLLIARRFVLLVPLGMALVGMSIGDGREAYQSALGQLLALGALGVLSACWVWSGRILRLPNEARVFGS
jgi:tight adherence protein B